jgi:hypothetical protein
VTILRNISTLIKHTLLPTILSSEPSESHTIFALGGSCIDVHDFWLIRVMIAADDWNGYDNILK